MRLIVDRANDYSNPCNESNNNKQLTNPNNSFTTTEWGCKKQ